MIGEAVTRVEDEMKNRRKQLKKEGKSTEVPEDDPQKVGWVGEEVWEFNSTNLYQRFCMISENPLVQTIE